MRKSLFICIFILISFCVFAKYDMEYSTINQFQLPITNFGIFGQDVTTDGAGAYWPAGYPSETYIFGAGIWVAGLIDTFVSVTFDTLFDTLVTVGYYPSSGGATEFVPGDGTDGPAYSNIYERVYNSTFDWPPMDKKGNIIYDSIISMQDLYCEFSDLDTSVHFDEVNLPLGLQISLTTYAWTNPILEDVVFLRYKIKNVREDGKTINRAYIGIYADNDIGYEGGSAANDLLGFIDTITTDYGDIQDTLMQLNTVYQFQIDSEPGWGHKPGIITYTFLETPRADNIFSIYRNGTFITHRNEQIGMSSLFKQTLATSPRNKIERYITMAGYDHLSYDPANPEASYNPFPYWGNNNPGFPGQNEDPSWEGDKRFLMNTGPFSIPAGDSVEFVLAIYINTEPENIEQNASNLIYYWNNRELLGIDMIEENNTNKIYAKIINNKLQLSVFSDNEYFNINVYDIQGRLVENIFKGRVRDNINIEKELNYKRGVYFIKDITHSNIEPIKLIILQ